MVTDNTPSQENTTETQPEAPQNSEPTQVQSDETALLGDGDQAQEPSGVESNEQSSADTQAEQKSFTPEEVSKLQSAEHKNQDKLKKQLVEMQARMEQLEAENKRATQQETQNMIEQKKVQYAEKLTADYVDQGYDANTARRMANRQAADEAAIYMQRVELNQEKERLAQQREKNQQENRLTTKHKIANQYGIDPSSLDVFTTPEQMENYAKVAGKLVQTGNQLASSGPSHNTAESIAADGSPQNEQSLIQKYLSGDRSQQSSDAVRRMMGR